MSEATDNGASTVLALSDAFGISGSYYNIWGERIAVAQDSLLALLTGLGVNVESPDARVAATHRVRAAAWRAALPPVVAIAAGAEQWALTLHLPDAAAPLRWTITEEDGARHCGESTVDALAPLAQAEIDGIVYRERRLELSVALPLGYHRLRIDSLPGETLIICAPARCYLPPALQDGQRVWGLSAQLYALRSERNWGIGDFGDLAKLAELAAEQGASLIGINPLHALFPHNPAHASPYSPSSRVLLNVLYLDIEAIPEFRECEPAQRRVRSAPFQARLAALREAPLVDYPGVAAAKFEVLNLLYAHFREQHLGSGTARDMAFQAFRRSRGRALRLHATFEALQAHLHAADTTLWGWPVWPEEYRDHDSPAVARFENENLERVEYYEYLQWQAAQQLAHAGERCRAQGLAVGLYLDLAVSVDRAGADAWINRECYALEASIGAPPDEFNPNGQDWGLPPLRPDRLRAHGYRLFIDTVRENMRDAGALRIDHVMGLMRLFWIPCGVSGGGTYVHYALEEMLAIVALESERNCCMVIGEDLGTVADEMRAALARYGVLSYRLLYFERGEGGVFKSGADYPRDALVAVSTHDLATLAGWWAGRDLQQRLELGLFRDHAIYERQLVDRAQERVRLMLALQHAGLLPPDTPVEPTASQVLGPALVEAIHAYLALAPSRVMMAQIEDAIGVIEQVNMPGTTNEHPNWCRKLPEDLDKLFAGDRMRGLAATLTRVRPRPPRPRGATESAAPPASEARVPRATYRLQFNKDFRFDDATRILPYLARLGVSHVYCSPILRARPGSLHGYDIVAHDEINPELGGAAGFEHFSQALRAQGMGQLLDMVPNHMGVLGADNTWWMDVLENGPASDYAQYFDIDWHPVNTELEGKVLVPVLGDHYGNVLKSGDLVLHFERDAGCFALRYHEHRFPLNPRSYPAALKRVEALLTDVESRAAVSSLAASFGHLPRRDAHESEARAERARDKEIHKGRLARLAARKPDVAQAIEAVLAEFNAEGAHDALHELLEVQAYRLTYWRVASDEINYRRFFDINDLAALRMENEQVFEATHAFVLELAASGTVDGLRIDHADGLYDPAQYFRRLQEGYARRAGIVLPEHDERGRPARALYVVVEKIVAPHEKVPDSWHVHGTTGYQFASVVNGVLMDAAAESKLDRIWRSFTNADETFENLAYEGKRAIMRSALASELTVLATELLRIARADRRTRDYTFNTLRQALAEAAACMPVYRTYIIDEPSPQDLRYIDWALAHARRRSRAADVSIFDFVRRSILGRTLEGTGADLQARVRLFALRFQQFTSPVAAKGVEDTAFYRYNRLISLNEVGGDPSQFGMTVRAFHAANSERAAHWPHTLLATSTHDNKRSEDVRNRINVLSEMPAGWRLALRRWRKLNRIHRSRLDTGVAPAAADEYMLYQTLLGTIPVQGFDEDKLNEYRERIAHYALKAARESKANTSWISPNDEYERALGAFVRGLLARLQPNPFLDDLRAQAATLAWFGALNSIAMTVIKFTAPGVPDVYQGNEVMDLSLVDPDNRRPVDFSLRSGLLDAFEAVKDESGEYAASLLDDPLDGRAKLWAAWRLLMLRKRLPALFKAGDYRALTVQGPTAEHVVAFCRVSGDTCVLVVCGRLFARLLNARRVLPTGKVWGDTQVVVPFLADGSRLTDVLTGVSHTLVAGTLPLAKVCQTLPAAVLLLESGESPG